MLIQKIKREAATLRDILYHRMSYAQNTQKDIVDQFHRLYYDSFTLGKTWGNTSWRGVTVGKCPFDLWLYQELIFELQPDLLIETGTSLGGSAYYYASLMDLNKRGRVVTIDIDPVELTRTKVRNARPQGRPAHERIEYLMGSSTSREILARVGELAQGAQTVLVSLDSDHSKKHVLEELRVYSPYVTRGSYIVVEDSNINGHPVYPAFGPGPLEAVEEFMKGNADFAMDPRNENHLMTFNPRGLLKRIR